VNPLHATNQVNIEQSWYLSDCFAIKGRWAEKGLYSR